MCLLKKLKEANGIIAFCSDKLTKADKEIEKVTVGEAGI